MIVVVVENINKKVQLFLNNSIFMFQLLTGFCYIYPQNKECLFENFPIYKAKLLELAKTTLTTLRDTTLKNIITEYLDIAPGTLIYIYLCIKLKTITFNFSVILIKHNLFYFINLGL